MPDAALAGLLITAAVFVLSAVGKVRHPAHEAERIFLSSAGVRRVPTAVLLAHPWVELLLAVGLVALSGTPLVVVASAAVGLMAVYLVLVLASWRSDEMVGCACFGGESDRIGPRTIARNVVLVAVAAVGLSAALADRSVVGSMTGEVAWWIVAGVVAAALVALVLWPEAFSDDDLADYLRAPIPGAIVKDAAGADITLPELVRTGPQLLLYVSHTCGSCESVIERVPQWRDDIPALEFRFVTPPHRESEFEGFLADHPNSLYDDRGEVRRTLGLIGTPSAVLLGADGLLAGGPVAGWRQVIEFVDEIAAELDANAADLAGNTQVIPLGDTVLEGPPGLTMQAGGVGYPVYHTHES